MQFIKEKEGLSPIEALEGVERMIRSAYFSEFYLIHGSGIYASLENGIKVGGIQRTNMKSFDKVREYIPRILQKIDGIRRSNVDFSKITLKLLWSEASLSQAGLETSWMQKIGYMPGIFSKENGRYTFCMRKIISMTTLLKPEEEKIDLLLDELSDQVNRVFRERIHTVRQ